MLYCFPWLQALFLIVWLFPLSTQRSRVGNEIPLHIWEQNLNCFLFLLNWLQINNCYGKNSPMQYIFNKSLYAIQTRTIFSFKKIQKQPVCLIYICYSPHGGPNCLKILWLKESKMRSKFALLWNCRSFLNVLVRPCKNKLLLIVYLTFPVISIMCICAMSEQCL